MRRYRNSCGKSTFYSQVKVQCITFADAMCDHCSRDTCDLTIAAKETVAMIIGMRHGMFVFTLHILMFMRVKERLFEFEVWIEEKE